jgi:sugar lactone lactonase YvrE
MRAEQVTGPIAYHAEGPVWSERWGGLRWVDMLAGDVLSLSGDGMVGRRHVGRIVAALRPRLQGSAVLGVERGFALEAWASWTASPDYTHRRTVPRAEETAHETRRFHADLVAHHEEKTT